MSSQYSYSAMNIKNISSKQTDIVWILCDIV